MDQWWQLSNKRRVCARTPNQAGFYHRNAVHQRYVDVPRQAFEGGAARMPPQLRMVVSEALSEAFAARVHAGSNSAPSQAQSQGQTGNVSAQAAAGAAQGAAAAGRDGCSGAQGGPGSPSCPAGKGCAAQDDALLPLMRQAFEDAQSLRCGPCNTLSGSYPSAQGHSKQVSPRHVEASCCARHAMVDKE